MEKWTDMNIVVFDGTAADRDICAEHEFHFEGKGGGARGPAKFDVMLVRPHRPAYHIIQLILHPVLLS
jgi:hypothetical protein